MAVSQAPVESAGPSTHGGQYVATHGVPVYSQLTLVPNDTIWWQRQMSVKKGKGLTLV